MTKVIESAQLGDFNLHLQDDGSIKAFRHGEYVGIYPRDKDWRPPYICRMQDHEWNSEDNSCKKCSGVRVFVKIWNMKCQHPSVIQEIDKEYCASCGEIWEA